VNIVCNSTPLIGLAAIGRFDLLHAIFGRIVIAPAVWTETVTQGRIEGGARREVESAKWIDRIEVTDQLAVRVLLDELDHGEAETIVLALELGAEWVVMDERKGRRKLEQLGIPKVGTLGILLKGRQAGLIPMLRPEINRLRASGFSVSDSVVSSILAAAGE
jgi:predicted nucleic acid-binding protein